jgi:arginine/ornithine N-succinyltransferase beta subunit
LKQIRTVRNSVKATVAEVTNEQVQSEAFYLANTRQDFRACKGTLGAGPNGVRINAELAAALKVGVGDPVRWIAPFSTAAAVASSASAGFHEGL